MVQGDRAALGCRGERVTATSGVGGERQCKGERRGHSSGSVARVRLPKAALEVSTRSRFGHSDGVGG